MADMNGIALLRTLPLLKLDLRDWLGVFARAPHSTKKYMAWSIFLRRILSL